MSEKLCGRCLCGAVRYECGPLIYPPTLCHCTSCRRASGAHALGWVTVKTADLRITAGSPQEFQSSPGVWRTFCGRCGAPIGYRNDRRPGEVDLTIGTLEEPSRVAPVDHIWMVDAASWDRPADGLPQYAESRRSG